jgi:hypothetical protein
MAPPRGTVRLDQDVPVRQHLNDSARMAHRCDAAVDERNDRFGGKPSRICSSGRGTTSFAFEFGGSGTGGVRAVCRSKEATTAPSSRSPSGPGGDVTVQFRNMKDHFNTPESKEALRQEILEAVPVTEIPPERIYGRPPIPLRLLTNPDVHSAFLDGEWRMTELAGLGPLEVAALRSVSATTGPSLPAIPDESPGPTGTRIVLHARADADLDSPVIGPNIPLTCAQKNA